MYVMFYVFMFYVTKHDRSGEKAKRGRIPNALKALQKQ